MEIFLSVLAMAWMLFVGFGWWIALQKNRRGTEGAILGLLFGPLGCLVEALLPNQTPELTIDHADQLRAMEEDSASKNRDRSRILTGCVWLVGLGVLFETRMWWPGILFLGAATAWIQAWAGYGADDRRGMIRAGAILALVGLWALTRFNMAFLLVGFGALGVVSALRTPPVSRKPYVDHRLD